MSAHILLNLCSFLAMASARCLPCRTHQTPPPELMKIPEADRLGVTAVLLMCLYRDQEFFRVGYYVNNELKDAPPVVSDDMDVVLPPPTDPTTLIRNILVDQPRVTRFPISWE